MVIHFYVQFSSAFGQSLAVSIKDGASTEIVKLVPLEYLNSVYWRGSIDSAAEGITGKLIYSYIFKDPARNIEKEFCMNSEVNLKKVNAKSLDLFDEWKEERLFEPVFQSKAFKKIPGQVKLKSDKNAADPTHIFITKAPEMIAGKVICLAGSAKKFNEWNESRPILLHKRKHDWAIKLDLSKETFPIAYKFGIYDTEKKTMDLFEEGDNRVLEYAAEKDKLSILHQLVTFSKYQWKGTGVNIPVSALKTAHSWGIGDFTNLHLLVDWAKATGIKLIQLLPVNDTTARFTAKDSYPYAAISAFALHPVYLNVQKLATAFGVKFKKEITDQVSMLNEGPNVDHDAVVKIKQAAIKALYEKGASFFKDDLDWFSFFDLNRHWLEPYAAFCFLRDKYNTPDFNEWEDHKIYSEDAIEQLVSVGAAHYDEIAIHYFTQYHLHLQLQDAADHAHKNGIILKGDLPIGVGRFSTDTWMHPQLFYMDLQAGAPPDAFSTKGQNWSFPVYNWEKMEKDNYSWWRRRMEHMGNYFDAVRIDHVLGFYRIWTIPLCSIEGILGRFFPAWPISIDDLKKSGILFNGNRFCKAFVTDEVLNELFGNKAAWVKDTCIDGNFLKDEYDTQQKVDLYFDKHPENSSLKPGLFDLIANVILLRDEKNKDHYHFRINMNETSSYKALSPDQQNDLDRLYEKYFFHDQNELWKEEGRKKLTALKKCTDMLLCAEDLGMVPDMVESMLDEMDILSLQVQRMPKTSAANFSDPGNAAYLSVVTPSTHDMSTLREWWGEDRKNIQYFYNQLLGQHGDAPLYCEPWICKEIIRQHLRSPAMLAVFLLQDLLAMDGKLRREDIHNERINDPADPDHNWNYRMHITLEELIAQHRFTVDLKSLITENNR